MPRTTINRSSPDKWKQDIIRSVDLYNSWFMEFAPKAFREMRSVTAERVERALNVTNNLADISCELLKEHPEILPILRMSICPPIARDRLVGLAGVSKTLVESMEDASNPRIPAISDIGYEAAEGIDWVWEHRIDDLALYGL